MPKKDKKEEKKSPNIRKYGLLAVKIFIFASLLTLIPAARIFNIPQKAPLPIKTYDLALPPPPPFPENISNTPAPFVSAEAVLLSDVPSGVILYQKNADVRLSPASTTKIITAITALDHFKLDDVLTVQDTDPNEATMGLIRGEKLTLESLLYGLLVKSANDSALAIAQNYPGGVPKFVEAMNQKAASLGLVDTHFTNPMGFDDTNHYTTAYELSKITRLALKDPIIAKIVATRSITVSDTSYTYFHELRNVNQLLGGIPGVAGVKTGFTENAAECLVTLVKRNGHEIITVVLGSKDRFSDTASLISWAYQNHTWVDISQIPIESNHLSQ